MLNQHPQLDIFIRYFLLLNKVCFEKISWVFLFFVFVLLFLCVCVFLHYSPLPMGGKTDNYVTKTVGVGCQ